MNTKLKTGQLAKALGVANGSISMAIKGNKLIRDHEGLIDIESAVNKVWINSQVSKGKTFDINRVFEKTKASIDKKNRGRYNSSESKPLTAQQKDIDKLTLDKLRVDLEKQEADLMLKNLQIEKMQGKLIPVDAVRSVFIFSTETLRSTFLQELNSIANVFVQKANLDQSKFVEIKKEISEITKSIMIDFKENLISGVDGVVDEYKEVGKND